MAIEKQDSRKPSERALAFAAGILLAIDFVGYHSAIDYIGSGILMYDWKPSQAIIVTLSGWILFGERPNRYILVSLPLVMLGLVPNTRKLGTKPNIY